MKIRGKTRRERKALDKPQNTCGCWHSDREKLGLTSSDTRGDESKWGSPEPYTQGDSGVMFCFKKPFSKDVS